MLGSSNRRLLPSMIHIYRETLTRGAGLPYCEDYSDQATDTLFIWLTLVALCLWYQPKEPHMVHELS